MTESIRAFTKMLRDAKAEPPLLVNMDAAGEFTSAEFLSELDKRKISYRLKKPGREQKNAPAMVDTAIGKQGGRKQQRRGRPWHHSVIV